MTDDREVDSTAGSDGGSVFSRVVPNFIRRRFTLKFALILVVMGLAIGVIGATATGAVAEQVEQNVKEEYQNLASQQANAIETWVERNSISVKLASKDTALSRTDPGSRFDIQQELATTAGNVYGVHGIYLLNYSEHAPRVVASPQISFEMNLSETTRAWIQSTPFDSLDVMDVHVTDVHRVGETPVVAFVSPAADHPDRYLVMEYSVADLASSIDTTSDDRFTQVVNDDGIVQVAGESAEVLGQYGDQRALHPVTLAATLRGTDRPAGVIPDMAAKTAVIDEQYTVGYAPISVTNVPLNWTVLVHEPRSSVYGFVWAISRWGRLATLGGVILVGVLGAAIGYNTTRDLNRLRHWAGKLRDGDLEATAGTSRIDAIGELYDGFENMRSSLNQQITEAERARKEAEVSRAEAMRMNEYLQQKAEEYSDTMRQCADGDLTQRLDPDGENEAMDQIATSFNEMVAELERTTEELKQFAVRVEETGEVLQASSDSVRVASGHVADSVQRIADDADDQKERLQDVSAEIDDLADSFEQLAAEETDQDVDEQVDRLNEIAARVGEVATLSEETLAESGIVAGAAEEQASELTAVSERAQDLTQYARPLHDALEEFDTDSEGDLYVGDLSAD
ncbi:methyl-accepting chemotaxis protein [Halorhabdus sp. CBA1104]|uniref:HAMP domain-containing protein n=1 Tax=Halorhabdus sp. CBA1104 TaxID=1380432 RepID=UPI0012B1BEBC|nr:methyl-accepting chemotaxis protein [Halorhabdus sp. CBA1104]QGN07247.1 methyl-accepting chemotaxis protein [Halorhabdus sp. CBA1104]